MKKTTKKTTENIQITSTWVAKKLTPEIIYFRESAFQSILADCVTFGFVFGGLILNHTVLHARWYLDIFFILLFFIISGARGNKKAKRFTDIKKFKQYVKEMK